MVSMLKSENLQQAKSAEIWKNIFDQEHHNTDNESRQLLLLKELNVVNCTLVSNIWISKSKEKTPKDSEPPCKNSSLISEKAMKALSELEGFSELCELTRAKIHLLALLSATKQKLADDLNRRLNEFAEKVKDDGLQSAFQWRRNYGYVWINVLFEIENESYDLNVLKRTPKSKVSRSICYNSYMLH